MECWNLGILEENTLEGDESLLVLGTQMRAPPIAGIPSPAIIPAFPYSNIPVEVIRKSTIDKNR
jgi:hypothetical protein